MEYYKFNVGVYKLIEKKLFHFIMLLVFLSIAAYFIYTGERTSDSNSVPYWVFTLLPVAIFLYHLGYSIQFNHKEKTFEVTFFGILIKKHDLKQFQNLLIINHKSYFMNNGTEVKCVFLENNTKKEVKITRRNRFKYIDDFTKETKTIINKILK